MKRQRYSVRALNSLTLHGNLSQRVVDSLIKNHDRLATLQTLKLNIYVPAGQIDTVAPDFARLYPFAELVVYQDQESGTDHYDEIQE